MAKILTFPCRQNANSSSESRNSEHVNFELHLERYQMHYGRDAYWFFCTKHHQLPSRNQALDLSALLKHKLKSADGKYYLAGATKANERDINKSIRARNNLTKERLNIEASAQLLQTVTTAPALIASELLRTSNIEVANQIEYALKWWADFSREWTSNDQNHKGTPKKTKSSITI